jgi:hypothetical protein
VPEAGFSDKIRQKSRRGLPVTVDFQLEEASSQGQAASGKAFLILKKINNC